MFRRCEVWQAHVGPGSWPDCDMLPLGKIGIGFHKIGRGNNTLIQANTVGESTNSFFVYQQVYDENGKPIEGMYRLFYTFFVVNTEIFDRFHFQTL